MLEPEIIYEDEDILAVNKPAGLVVHEDGRTEEPSVSEWFVKKYPESKDVGEGLDEIERSGVVHRIDRDTSGVLLLAKTSEGHECLKKQFQRRNIEKFYHAFVHGQMKDDRGTINMPIGKSPRDFRRWSAERGARGEMREAITYFEVLKRSDELDVTLVEAKPKTGRTHQIRVHFRALQRPILGDKLYGTKATQDLGEVWGFSRLALHARKIIFKNNEGKIIETQAPYPKDFELALEKIGFKS